MFTGLIVLNDTISVEPETAEQRMSCFEVRLIVRHQILVPGLD